VGLGRQPPDCNGSVCCRLDAGLRVCLYPDNTRECVGANHELRACSSFDDMAVLSCCSERAIEVCDELVLAARLLGPAAS
jgi:hypothetical protein